MKDLITSLQGKKPSEIEYNVKELMEQIRTIQTALGITFAHAIIHEHDMMESQTDNVRASLIWLDSWYNDLENLKDEL